MQLCLGSASKAGEKGSKQKLKYSRFRRDVKPHFLTFSTKGQRQVTTCCILVICAVTSRKKCHVSGCRRQAGDVFCLLKVPNDAASPSIP